MIEQMAMTSGARDVFLDEDLLGGMSVHVVNEKAASHIGSCSRFVLRKHCCSMEKIGVTKVRLTWVTPIFTCPSFGVLSCLKHAMIEQMAMTSGARGVF